MLLRFEDVTKTFGTITALDKLSLTVPSGAIGLLGPNGSGKTTMIRALLGLVSVDAGSGEVLGMDFRRQQLDIRRAVGFAPEDECLFPHVVGIEFVTYAGELVGMSRTDAMQRAHEVLDYVGLGEARYRGVESYSTGMKQRLKIASALVHDPKLLILDEPTNGMDPVGRQELLELARDLAYNKGISLLFSSHLLPDVEFVCEYVVVLGKGKLLAAGKIQELKQIHPQCFDVRLKAGLVPYAGRLSALGCSTALSDDVLRVQLPAGRSPQILWQVAAEEQLQIRSLRPQRSTLEEVFLQAVELRIVPIFDQGYQHWTGELSGHAWRWLTITRHGVRVSLSGRWLRLLLLVAWLPAFGLVFMLCLWGLLERNSELIGSILPLLGFLDKEILASPRPYRIEIWTLSYSFFLAMELRFAMLLVLLVGPNLISQDLRYNALPLYFSRPLRRIDYFLGKLGVIVAFLGLVIIVPLLVAYLLGMLFSLDLAIVRDTFGILLASIAYGLIIAVSAGLLILALSSLSRNSRYVTLFWIGILLVGSTLAGILQRVDREQRIHQARRAAQENQSVELPVNELEAAKTDWRPLLSYTANLSRVGQQLLGTDACWEKLSRLQPPGRRSEFLLDFQGGQYPWYWSAAVLVALMGLSVCILNFAIKSLDRLK